MFKYYNYGLNIRFLFVCVVNCSLQCVLLRLAECQCAVCVLHPVLFCEFFVACAFSLILHPSFLLSALSSVLPCYPCVSTDCLLCVFKASVCVVCCVLLCPSPAGPPAVFSTLLSCFVWLCYFILWIYNSYNKGSFVYLFIYLFQFCLSSLSLDPLLLHFMTIWVCYLESC